MGPEARRRTAGPRRRDHVPELGARRRRAGAGIPIRRRLRGRLPDPRPARRATRGGRAARLGGEGAPGSTTVARTASNGAWPSSFPTELTATGATTAAGTVRLEPRAERRLRLELGLREGGDGTAAPAPPPAGAETRPTAPWPGGITRVTSDSLALNEILERSFADLHLLRSTLRGHAFIAAGIPWFATLFGRDSLIAAPPAPPLHAGGGGGYPPAAGKLPGRPDRRLARRGAGKDPARAAGGRDGAHRARSPTAPTMARWTRRRSS